MSRTKTKPHLNAKGKPILCVFHGSFSKGPFKGEIYQCGANAVGDYYDPLFKCRRPVCRVHANVVNRRCAKTKEVGVVYFE